MKEKLKTWFACIGTVAFARKVNVNMSICRGGHEGIINVETNSDRQGQTRTDKQ